MAPQSKKVKMRFFISEISDEIIFKVCPEILENFVNQVEIHNLPVLEKFGKIFMVERMR